MKPTSIERHKSWLRNSFILQKISKYAKSINDKLKTNIYGKSPEFFASSKNYPDISFGSSVSISKPISIHELFGKSYDEIIKARLSNIIAKRYGTPKTFDRLTEVMQALAMSKKPIYTEVELSKKPRLLLRLSPNTYPVGPSSPVKRLIEAENPKIPKKVYELYNEKINAELGVLELYVRGFDYYYIQRLFSAGVLGRNKKIVPTRWSITAVDGIISKFNKKKVLRNPVINNIMVFTSYFLFNKFVVLMMPGPWAFENFEAWAPKTTWGAKNSYLITEEFESAKGRKTYAESQAGAYYAVRNVVLEYLAKIKRQASVVVIREVYEGYNIPVGVWQIRENVKNALEKEYKKFESTKEAEDYINTLLRIPFKKYKKKSRILRQSLLTSLIHPIS